MKTQIKRWGNSNVVILSTAFMDYYKLKVGDWLDLSDVVLIREKEVRKNENK